MCFKFYTYPYFTYISNFQFSPTPKSTQSYHTQPKHNPPPPTISNPTILSSPPSTPISHCYIHTHPLPYPTPITSPSPSLTYPPYRSFIVLSISNPIQSYLIQPNPTQFYPILPISL